MNLLTMAWRNVWRNRRRSMVVIGAMTLALIAMIQYAGLMTGYFISMERNVLDLETGDVKVFAIGYRDTPSLHTRIADPGALLATLDELGYPAAARLKAGGLGAGDDSSSAVMLIGVDVERDKLISRVHEYVYKGTWLDPSDPTGVVLGKRLAKNLSLKAGGELLVLTQAADGSTANEVYKVLGVLSGISNEVDYAGVFMHDTTFRELMVVPNGAHQIIVRKPLKDDLETMAQAVREKAPNLDVKTWKELQPMLASMMEMGKQTQQVMFMIVYLAVGILILNAMLMAVYERIRELGVLKALGVRPRKILGLLFTEAFIQTGIAIAVGIALGAPLLYYLSTTGIDLGELGGFTFEGIAADPVWRAAFGLEAFQGPISTLYFVVMVAVFFPALRAARLKPVEAIAHR